MTPISAPDSTINSATNLLSRRVTLISGIILMLSIPPSFFGGGATPAPVLLLVVVALGVFINWRKRLGAGKLFAAMLVSLAIVWFASFFAYLTNGSSIPTSSGLSPHDNYSLGEAAGRSLFAPLISIPTFFGYSCQVGGAGPYCSNGLLIMGFLLIESVWIGGLVVGNLLVRQDIR